MPEQTVKKHVHFPKETPAFFCANCGAVSLDSQSICKVQGSGTKADWCGIKDNAPPQLCENKVNNLRFVCDNCGKVSVNPELLCEPVEMGQPKEERKIGKITGFWTLLKQEALKLLGWGNRT